MVVDERLSQQVLERLSTWAADLGVALHAAWMALVGELDLEGRRGPPYFLHPLALPVLQLPAWVGRSLPGLEPAAVLAASESAAAGYLHVRIRDDQLDDGRVPDPARLLLSDLLLARHLDLLIEASGSSSAFRPLMVAAWARGAEAMLQEGRAQRGEIACDRSVFLQVLGRSRLMGLPALALLHHAGRPEQAPLLEAVVDPLVEGHQLAMDLIDFEKDLAAGNLTHVLHRMGALEDPAGVRRRLLLEGGFDAISEEARQRFQAAEKAAMALGTPEMTGYLEARLELVEEARRRIFNGLFLRLLGGEPSKGRNHGDQG